MTELGTADTTRMPVTTTYHGVEVTEDYRWLEDAGSEQTRAWTETQHEQTMAYPRSLPSYDDIRRRAEEILEVDSTTYTEPTRGGQTYFVLKDQPPKQQPFLVALTDLSDAATERALVDPNAIDPSGATTIDWYVPSPDGHLVAVSLSSHGTEEGTLHLFDAATGDLVDVRIPRVNAGAAGGSMAWRGDSAGFWYTRHPAPGERPTRKARSSKRSGSTRSAARRTTAGTSPRCSPTSGSSRTSCRLHPTDAGRWTAPRRATAASGSLPAGAARG